MSYIRATRLAGAALLMAGPLIAAACTSDDDGGTGVGGVASADPEADLPAAYEGYESELYTDDANWLCRPDLRDDVCRRDLDATIVRADGTTEVERHEPAADPAIDCFYVYPTTSRDPALNSDLSPGEGEEISTVYNQAARLTASCRVFAPLYRQVTLSALGGGGERGDGDDPWAVAYGDVLDAFREYVAHYSEGRGFVLVGHSQGGGMLNRLLQDEIDHEPLLRDRMVSAVLLGSSVSVPGGRAVGGDFDNLPLCEAPDQVGCIVSYASFRSTSPPPAGSLFGRSRTEGQQVACTNPARLEGGSASLHPYFAVRQNEGSLLGGAGAQPFADPARTAEITTPFVTYPDLVSGECVSDAGATYLSLTIHGDPAGARTDDIGGDLTPEWGMHLIDMNVAMGDLVDLVSAQAQAYTG